MSDEPESVMLQLMRQMRVEIGDMRGEMHSFRADVAADFIDVDKKIAASRKDLGDQMVGVRRAVVEYHSSVIGHGAIISDLEARVRRVEQHLDLPPLDTH